MSSIINFLKGKKTFVIAGLLVLVSLVNMLTGDIGISELLSDPSLLILLNGLGLAALRAAK